MLIIKLIEDIQNAISNKIFADCIPCENWSPSHYMLFVKDIHYLNEPHNNKTLIIVEKNSNYVVNNDLRFNKLVVKEESEYYLYEFHYIANPRKSNKSNKVEYYLIK
jgi:hypothetical protein